MTGANMQADSSKMGSGAADNGSGGLHNLFALAHLAAMSEEERGIAARSPPTTTATASATSQSKDEQENAATRTPSPPNRMAGSRRPAKKRAVPADFDAVDMAPQEHNGTTGVSIADGAPFESPSNKSPKVSASAPAVAATSPSTSSTKPPTTTKRPRKIKSKTMSSSAKSQQQHQRKGSNTFKMKANQPSFPVILMAILSAPQNREFVTFLGDGKRFIIIQPRALARNVLPMHFEENVPSFDQFLYLLAIWGFETVKDPGYPQVNVYKHPMFRNGDWEACLQIKLPNPNDQQAALKNQAAKASSSPTQNGHATRNIPALPDPASPRLNAAADVQANNDLSPGTMARSVTPPMEIKSLHSLMHQPHFLSDATLLERVAATQNVATQTSQHQRQQQFSNLGPKYTGMKENLMYRHLLQESGMLVQDQASVFLQTQLHRDISLGRKSSMMGYSHPTVSRGAMPMNHRRATLGMPPSNSCDVANFPSMNHRRATLDMPPSFSMSGNNAMATGMMGGQMPSHFAPSFHHGHQPPQQQMPSQRMQAPIMNTTPSATTPSDAEVRSATEDIVSKAMDALRSKNNVSRRLTIEHPPTSHGGTARLDAMTDVFLERSLARLSGNRPTMGSMMGGSRNSPMQQQPDVPSMQHQQAFMAREDGMMSRQQHSLIAAASVSAAEEACIAAAAQALGRHHSHRKVSILGHMPLSYGR